MLRGRLLSLSAVCARIRCTHVRTYRRACVRATRAGTCARTHARTYARAYAWGARESRTHARSAPARTNARNDARRGGGRLEHVYKPPSAASPNGRAPDHVRKPPRYQDCIRTPANLPLKISPLRSKPFPLPPRPKQLWRRAWQMAPSSLARVIPHLWAQGAQGVGAGGRLGARAANGRTRRRDNPLVRAIWRGR